MAETGRCAAHPDREATATCARCGDYACLDCEVRRSDGSFCARCAPESGPAFPWEDRGKLGILRAAMLTIAGSLSRPYELYRRGFRERSSLPALAFSLVVSVPFAIATAIPAAIADQPAGFSHHLAIGAIVSSPIASVVVTFANAALWWLGLKIVGGARRRFMSLVRTTAYVSAATAPLSLVSLAPGLTGALLSIASNLFMLVVQVSAVRGSQDIEVWRVVLAFVASMALLLAGLVPLVLIAIRAGIHF